MEGNNEELTPKPYTNVLDELVQRQTSTNKIKLSPVHLSQENLLYSSDEDETVCRFSERRDPTRIVGYTMKNNSETTHETNSKTPPCSRRCSTQNGEKNKNPNFKIELNEKLKNMFIQQNSNNESSTCKKTVKNTDEIDLPVVQVENPQLKNFQKSEVDTSKYNTVLPKNVVVNVESSGKTPNEIAMSEQIISMPSNCDQKSRNIDKDMLKSVERNYPLSPNDQKYSMPTSTNIIIPKNMVVNINESEETKAGNTHTAVESSGKTPNKIPMSEQIISMSSNCDQKSRNIDKDMLKSVERNYPLPPNDQKYSMPTSTNIIIPKNMVVNINESEETKAGNTHTAVELCDQNHKTQFLVVNHVDYMGNYDVNTTGTIKAINIPKQEMTLDCDVTRVGGPRKETNMATLRPKSPASRPIQGKNEKDESIWDKIGTLGRKKRIKEVQEVQAEGKYAIDSPGLPAAPVIPPEEYNLEDNEERCIIDPKAWEDVKFQELMNVLKEWINDELASQRIIVQDLIEDLYDGQVLQKLLEKLTGDKLDVPEVTQSEEGQKQKLAVVLAHFNQVLGIQRLGHNKWTVETIHSKNIVAIIHLLVSLARHFRPPVRLTENVTVDVVVVKKQGGQLNHKIVRESLTKSYDDVGMRCERDAFDTLFDHAPEKLQVVKKSLVTFVNKHLNKMNFEVTELECQFHDGVYLIMLMGLLEGFFVPHYVFHLTPREFEQKVHNVSFAFELMEEVGLQKPKARPEDVVNMDLKSTLRVLYNLFLRYKTII